jgi:PAS domain S-box-containing protein
MFGWKAEEVIGRPYPLAPPGREHEVEAAINQVMRGEPLRSVERIRRRKDGSTLHVNLSTAPLRGAGGEIIGVVAILEDIVDRKRAEEELHRHRDHLEELVAERTAQLAEPRSRRKRRTRPKASSWRG